MKLENYWGNKETQMQYSPLFKEFIFASLDYSVLLGYPIADFYSSGIHKGIIHNFKKCIES